MNRDQRKTHRIVRNRNCFSAPLFASTPTYRYVYASYIDEPVVRKVAGTSGTIHYYHRNQQYSITAMTTSTGAVAERYAYTAYGQPTILNASGTVLTSSSVGNRYTYTGREWDETLGLHHFRARWMSPLAGRFLGRDPIGYVDGLNIYESYLGLELIDPLGLCTPKLTGPKQQFVVPKYPYHRGLVGGFNSSWLYSKSTLAILVNPSDSSLYVEGMAWGFGEWGWTGLFGYQKGHASAFFNCTIGCEKCKEGKCLATVNCFGVPTDVDDAWAVTHTWNASASGETAVVSFNSEAIVALSQSGGLEVNGGGPVPVTVTLPIGGTFTDKVPVGTTYTWICQ
jgi:RHS repeat-associated protein